MSGTTNRYINLFTAKTKMRPKEQAVYEDSLKDYWDLKSSMETYFNEGKAEGKAEGKIEIAKSALEKGLDIDLIQELTGLSKSEIEKLKST